MTNDGLIHLNPSPCGPNAMIVITGVGRSRTSMTARILQDAGLHIGDELDDVVFEDHRMAAHIDAGDPAQLAEAVAHRNACRMVWGFKKPGLHAHPAWPRAPFPHQRMIVMVRDPVAISVRHGLAHGLAAEAELARMTTLLQLSISFALGAGCPVLLVSAEKAVTSPEPYIREVMTFCGIPPTLIRVRRALRLIDLESEHYQQNARVS